MQFQVLPIQSESELPTFVEIETAAFGRLPVSKAMFPNGLTDVDLEALVTRRTKSFRKANTHFLKVQDVETGETVAIGSWSDNTVLQDIEVPAEKTTGNQEPRWPPSANAEVKEAIFGTFQQHRKTNLSQIQHYALGVLATHPGHQGRGAAKLLMQWGADRADDAGVDAYLEATENAKPLYEKFGFETTQELAFDLGRHGVTEDVRYYLMKRSRRLKR